MFSNYFKTAWRNLLKYPFYSLVNVVGLLSGITFTLLIGAYVWGELQVNKNLSDAGHQYILTTKSKENNFGYEMATFGPLAKRLKENYPQLVANYYRFDGITSIVSKGDKHFRENIQVGDSSLLTMYGFDLLYGNPKTALDDPSSVVIKKDMAIKYFGRTNVIGETINVQSFTGKKKDFVITGVLGEIPENSVTDLIPDYGNKFFIPTSAYTFFGRQDLDAWNNIYIGSYIELQKGIQIKDLERPIQHLIAQNASDFLKQNLQVVPVKLTDFYLNSNNHVVAKMILALSLIGAFILLMAIINFINISISRSSARLKEIGIRKVLGGIRRQLVFQFLTESVMLVLISTTLAIVLYPLLRPLFSALVGKEMLKLLSFPVYFVFIPIFMVLVIGLLAGLYPAIVQSSFRSVDSLKGKLKTVKETILLRKSLIGLQFSIALVVFIAAIIVTQQVSHFFGQDLGYKKEFVVAAMVPRDWSKAGIQKMETIRNEFSTMPQVERVTVSYEIPDGNNGGAAPLYRSGKDSTTAIPMQVLTSDENYLSTYQIPLSSGEFFAGEGLDSGKIVINDKAAHVLGFKNDADAVGQSVRIPGDPTLFTIKGVTRDFQFGSMQQTIPPIMFFNVNFSPQFRYISIKIRPGNISSSLAAIQKKWDILMPGSSFEYKFIDEALERIYATEIQLQKAAYTATVLAFIIALLGVLGLVSLSVHKRFKEIGIRKVLGASLQHIVSLFLKEFFMIIVVSGIIACPVAFLITSNWLNNYAYRIRITPMPFVLSIAGLGFLTALLIGMQTINAALKNPVKSLRSE
jgi:putative ABC transport system permease protein